MIIMNAMDLQVGDIFTLVSPTRARQKPLQVKELIKSFGDITQIKAQRRSGNEVYRGEMVKIRYTEKVIFLRHGKA